MVRRKKIFSIFGLVLAVVLSYLLLWPVPFDPAAWEPPTAPALKGEFARNDALVAAEQLDIGGAGSEDVEIDEEGRIYGGLADGRIMRIERPGAPATQLANTGGRPLGLDLDSNGNLIIADADRGLLSLGPAGEIKPLTDEYEGQPFVFTDDVDIASDGTTYFTDASTRWNRHHLQEEFLEHRAHGRLYAFHPEIGRTELVTDGLYFANGVAIADDDSFLLVNETSRYRVRKVWLVGERRGQMETVIENLPGLPDGISRGEDGIFWVALYSPRVSALDTSLPHPWLRKVIYRLPDAVQPAPVRSGFVIGIRADGQVVANLQDHSKDSFAPITSVEERDGYLYLGSLKHAGIARLPVPSTAKK